MNNEKSFIALIWCCLILLASCGGGSTSPTSAIVPQAPSNLVAAATSSGSIDLSWQDNADNETGFVVERSAISPTYGFAQVAEPGVDSFLYTDIGLMPATQYYYRVAAVNDAGISEYSEVATTTTEASPMTVPAAPSNLEATAVGSTAVSLFWTDNSDNESGFSIFRAIDSGGPYEHVISLGPDIETHNDTGLAASTTYFYRIAATNAVGSSSYSNVASVVTWGLPAQPPSAPTDISVTGATSSSLTLFWNDNSDNESGFKILRADSQYGAYTQVGQTGADEASYTQSGLSAATTYWYKVRAYNEAGNSADTSAVSGITLALPETVPNAPSGLAVGSATSSSLTLSWNDNSANELGFKILRANSQYGTYTQVAQVSADVTSHIQTGLSPETTYWYKVRAYNAAGDSADASAASGTTLAPAVTVPNGPSSLAVGSATSSSLALSWQDNSDNEQGFQIWRSIQYGDGTYSLYQQVNQLGANETSYIDTGLSSSTTYRYQVRAYNTAGNSVYSNLAAGTTLAPPETVPNAPSGMAVGSATSSSLTLSWNDNSDNELGFKILRAGSQYGTYTQMAQVSAGVTSYTQTGLNAATTYWYKVRAYNTAGDSADSNTASGTTAASVQTVTLNPLHENLVMVNSQNAATANTVNRDSGFFVGCNWTYSYITGLHDWVCGQGLLRFDISTLTGKTIDSAVLKLTTSYVGVGYYPRQWHIRAMASDWSTFTVTWNIVENSSNYPSLELVRNPASYTEQVYEIDITTVVRYWADGTISNNGLLFGSHDYTFPYATSYDAFGFYGRLDPGNAGPKLIVTYR